MDWEQSKYFEEKEFVCPCGCGLVRVVPKLVKQLNQARTIYGKAIKINSGFRCVEHNRKVGGKHNSAHLHGEAVDIGITDGVSRYTLLKVLYRCGFERIGVSKNFIHVDVSEVLPRPSLWTY